MSAAQFFCMGTSHPFVQAIDDDRCRCGYPVDAHKEAS